MGFDNSFTAVTGATYTAAQYNTYVRDNLTAIWVGTTAGDLDYYSAANAKARLAIGEANTVLTSDGSVPQWTTPANMGFLPGLLHAIGYDSFGDIGQTSTSTTIDTNVTGATLDLVISRTCTIIMMAHALMASAGAGHQAKCRGSIGGTVDSTVNNYGSAGATSYTSVAYHYRRANVAAGTITCMLKFGSSNSGVNALIERGGFLVMAFVE